MTRGEKIAKLRNEKGWTQKELANGLDVSLALVSAWERGERKVTDNALERCARLFDTTPDTLNGDNEPIPAKLQKKDGTAEAKILQEALKDARTEFLEAENEELKAKVEELEKKLAETEELKSKAANVCSILKEAARTTKVKIDELEQEISFLRKDKEELHRRLDEAKAQKSAEVPEDYEAVKAELNKLKDALLKYALRGLTE